MNRVAPVQTSESSNSIAGMSAEPMSHAASEQGMRLDTPLSPAPVPDSIGGRPKHESLKKCVFFFLDEPDSSIYAQMYLYLNYVLTMISTVGVLMQTVVDSDWNEFEHTIGVILLVDLILRIYASPRFLANGYNLLDVLNVVPYIIYLSTTGVERSTNNSFISFMWLMRVVLRIFKITRYFTGFQLLMSSVRLSAASLVTPLFFLMVLCVTFGVFLLFFEKDSGTDMFNNMFDGVWFSLVSLSTTGYGDKFPVTVGGKIFTGIFLVVGILYTAIPIAIMGNNFSQVWNSRDEILVVQKTKQRLNDLGIKEDDVKQAFMVFDTDNSGDIDLEEFQQLVLLLKLGLAQKKTISLFKAFDKDSSGNISYAEFAKTMFPGTIFSQGELEKQAEELKKKSKASAAKPDAEAFNRRLRKNMGKLKITKVTTNLHTDTPDEVKAKVEAILNNLLGPLERKVKLYRQAKFAGGAVSVTPAASNTSRSDVNVALVQPFDLQQPNPTQASSPEPKTKPYIPPVDLPKLPTLPKLPIPNRVPSSVSISEDELSVDVMPIPVAPEPRREVSPPPPPTRTPQVAITPPFSSVVVLPPPEIAPRSPSPRRQAGESLQTSSAMHFFSSPSPARSRSPKMRPASAHPTAHPPQLPTIRPQSALPVSPAHVRPTTAPLHARTDASRPIEPLPDGVRTPRLPSSGDPEDRSVSSPKPSRNSVCFVLYVASHDRA